MIKIKIAEIAEKRGLKNPYALQKALDCSPTMASRLWKGNFKQIGIETIDKLCELLRCAPSDLISFKSVRIEEEKPVKSSVIAQKAALSSESDSDLLSTIQAAAELGLSRKRVNDYIVSGDLKAVKGKQNHNFISRTELDRFKAARNETPGENSRGKKESSSGIAAAE